MVEQNFDDCLDVELFIEEVKEYPEIWNVALEEYHDRKKKRRAWMQICSVFYEGFSDKDEAVQNEICNKLIKKWRNIKDNYLKSAKKRKLAGQVGDTCRQYIYARQLSFLQQIRTTSRTNTKQVKIEEVESISSSPSPEYDRNSMKKHKRDMEFTPIDPISIQVGTGLPETRETNGDRSFFDSLIPFINEFTEDQIIEFRCEVLNIIKRMRREQNSASSKIIKKKL